MKYFKSLAWFLVAAWLAVGVNAAEISASGTISTENISTSETCTANSCVELDITNRGTVSVQIAGTYTGALTLQRSNNRITWETLTAASTFTNAANTSTATIGSGVTGTFAVANVAGFKWIRITALAEVTGTATITIYTSIPGGGGGGTVSATLSGTAHDTAAAAVAPILTGGYASAAAPSDVSADTDSVRAWHLRNGATVVQPSYAGGLAATGAGVNGSTVQRVTIATDDAMSTAIVGVAHDAAAGSVNPALIGCYASAAAPTDVSADTDATRAWCLRNGARAVTPTFAGVLPSTGVGLTGTGVQRVAVATDSNAATAAITMSTATTTQFVALSGSTKTYVSSLSIIAGGTTNVTLVHGTGSNCATDTTSLTGAYPLTAQVGLTLGGGMGAAIVVPAGKALCVTSSAAVQVSGHVTYTQY